MWWTALAGAILGALKANGEQKNADGQRGVEVSRELWSPWTGRHGDSVQNANWMGSMGDGVLAGLDMGQKMKAANGGKGQGAQVAGNSWTSQNNTQVNPYAMGNRG